MKEWMFAFGNFIRMLTRPAVTAALVGTICYLAINGNGEMVVAVGALGGVAVNAWFTDRGQRDKPAVEGEQ